MGIKKFDKEDANAIFSACGLDKDVKPEKISNDSECEPKNIAHLLLVDENGVWPNLELKKHSPNLGTEEYKLITWRPALEFVNDAIAPDVKKTPALPFPFAANELAAFMVDGVGTQIVDFFGDWSEGPCRDSLDTIDINFNKSKEALCDAYKAYREAEKAVVGVNTKPLEQALAALKAKHRRKSAQSRRSERLYIKSLNNKTSPQRRERAKTLRNEVQALVEKLREQIYETDRQYAESFSGWRNQIVRQLLSEKTAKNTGKAPDRAQLGATSSGHNALVRRRKLRTNVLDAFIEKAIMNTNSLDTATVYTALKELAINGEGPFTGLFIGDAICYTNHNNQPATLTLDALGKRLKRLTL